MISRVCVCVNFADSRRVPKEIPQITLANDAYQTRIRKSLTFVANALLFFLPLLLLSLSLSFSISIASATTLPVNIVRLMRVESLFPVFFLYHTLHTLLRYTRSRSDTDLDNEPENFSLSLSRDFFNIVTPLHP